MGITFISKCIFVCTKMNEYVCFQEFVVVRGNFSHTFLHVGYHKIAEIPAGACNISIQETKKSQNYLGTRTLMAELFQELQISMVTSEFGNFSALRTQSGTSIINGNWVIDRPGTYSALGTRLTYRRPNEIRSRSGESITAPGPLTDELHLYVRNNT